MQELWYDRNMETVYLIMMIIVGAMMGSFACCQAWRLHLKPRDLGKRSVCISCGHKLTWHENVPVISWLAQRGKCKKCGCFIGLSEILSEVMMAVIFGAFYAELGISWELLLMCLLMTGMWVVLVYDAKWGEMPVKVLLYCICTAVVYTLLVQNGFLDILLAIAVLPAVYFLLYKLSRERLVGSGDWMLCLSIALALGNWWLALIELFLSNMLGSMWGGLMMARGKGKKIHFAPFLILAFVAIYLAKDWLLALVRL